MSGITGINFTNNKHILRADNTGYAALAGIGLTTASAIIKSKSINKMHKPLAFISAGLTLLHLGVIIHNRNEWKKKLAETKVDI